MLAIGSAGGCGSSDPLLSTSSQALTSSEATGAFGGMDLGDNHGCVIRSDGAVYCWGYGASGQLGNGSTSNVNPLWVGVGSHPVVGFEGVPTSTYPYSSPSAAPATAATVVTAGGDFSCAMRVNGAVSCWGSNGQGELGNGVGANSSVPVSVGFGSGVRAIDVSAGYHFACGVIADGTVMCWGSGDHAQMGRTGASSTGNTPQRVVLGYSNLADATQVSTGDYHACALIADGNVRCWGLKIGDPSFSTSATPTLVSGFTGTPVALSSAGQHTCALMSDGKVNCWGDNSHGELGTGDTTSHTGPVLVQGIPTGTRIAKIGVGVMHACAVATTGVAYCWGENLAGEIGRGDNVSPVTTAAAVVSASGFTSISGGVAHTCATQTGSGGLRCWGSNALGQLGDGTTTNSNVPVFAYTPDIQYETFSTIYSTFHGGPVLEGGRAHYCTLVDRTWSSTSELRGVRCWGSNSNGQLGISTSTTQSSTPVWAAGLYGGTTDVTSVAAGGDHTCALKVDGTVQCWGRGINGELGNGASSDSATPVTVSLGAGVHAIAISAGWRHTCALIDDGTVRCWGSNTYGQLGYGQTSGGVPNASTNAPVTVIQYNAAYTYNNGPVLDRIIMISAGDYHTCARSAEGYAWCWGNNDHFQAGWYGNADGPLTVMAANRVPSSYYGVDGLAGQVTAVSAGDYHTCVRRANGSVWCWGDNTHGQLNGNSDSSRGHDPAPAGSIADSVSVSVGTQFSCAVTSDSRTFCWGTNGSLELGVGSSGTSAVRDPSSAGVDLVGVTRVAAGTASACALRSNGAVVCWGAGTNGQMGNGATAATNVPVFTSL